MRTKTKNTSRAHATAETALRLRLRCAAPPQMETTKIILGCGEVAINADLEVTEDLAAASSGDRAVVERGACFPPTHALHEYPPL